MRKLSKIATRAGQLLLAMYLLTGAGVAHTKEPVTGALAPDFGATSLVTGEKLRLSAERGKLVILTFWATWCAPCRDELPDLERIQGRVGKDKLAVLAVSYRDSLKTLRYVKKDVKAANWNIALLTDPDEMIARQYDISTIPRLFLIGRDGRILAVHAGYGDGSLDAVLGELNSALGLSGPAAVTLEPPAQP